MALSVARSTAMDGSRTHPEELFAERLNELFRTKLGPDGAQWKDSQVGAACGLSRAQVYNLRNPKSGRSRGPTWETIAALADFWGVSPSYFFPTTSTGKEQGELTRTMAELGVEHVAANTVGDDLAQMKATVMDVLQQIQRMEATVYGQQDSSRRE
jgi:transcriptional regulator with XRE-family HTH domain